MKKLLYFILIALCLSSCKKNQWDDCFTSTGEVKSELRQLPAFKKLKIGDKFHLVIVQDTSKDEHMIITGGKNLLEGISAKVTNGLLEIENTNICNFVRTFKEELSIELHIHKIDELIASAAVNISSNDTLHLDNLKIYQTALEDIDLIVEVKGEIFVQSLNSGGTYLRGKTQKLKGSIEEISNIDARDLVAEEVLLDVHTPLDCYIDGRRLIFVKIFNSGNVYYREEPTDLLELNVKKGSGDLILLP